MAKHIRGMCKGCGYVGTKASMTKHQAKCEARGLASGGEQVYRLRVEGGGPYWLDIEASAEATLDNIDDFLRGIWLECCGHMSEFSIGPQTDFDNYDPFEEAEESDQPLLHTLLEVGQKFGYTYDFSSSTDLRLTVQATEQVGSKREQAVTLLARNLPPVYPCSEDGCDQTAEWIHAWEYDEATNGPLVHCEEHVDEDELDDGAYLPLVNSPRTGVCGYEGGNLDNWPPPSEGQAL